MHRVAGLPVITGNEAPAEAVGHPNCSCGTIRSEASSSDGTGNRVSVNGARALVRATGAASNFGNGGRFADKTGPKGTVAGRPVVAPSAAEPGNRKPWPTWASPAEP
jgi:hypothetical protein